MVRRYNPIDVGRAAKLLQGGGVVGKSLQPYEAHVPFLLQLKIDLNLAGMGWLHLSQVLVFAPSVMYSSAQSDYETSSGQRI